jgi:hypothetical protein
MSVFVLYYKGEGKLSRGMGAVSHNCTCSDLIFIMQRVTALTKNHHPYNCVCIMPEDGL